jgi:hypothetical protein
VASEPGDIEVLESQAGDLLDSGARSDQTGTTRVKLRAAISLIT